MIKLVKDWFHTVPESKKYVEFISAVLTVPVLITVIYTNMNNIKKSDLPPKQVKAEAPSVIIKQETVSSEDEPEDTIEVTDVTPTPPATSPTVVITMNCKPQIGPIDIAYPTEGQTISDNPLPIDVEYKNGEYCAVVWSYRINESNWSEYDDKSFSLYDMPSGDKTLELRVKNLVSGEEKRITRKFTYKNTQTITSTPTPSPGSPTPTP